VATFISLNNEKAISRTHMYIRNDYVDSILKG